MVYVARGRFDIAEVLGRQGAAEQDRQARTGHRFPGVGFHWLLGTLHAAAGRHNEAIVELDQELAHADARRLYGPEYAVAALLWRGHSELGLGRPDAALVSFRQVHQHLPEHGRGFLGEALALDRLGDVRGSQAARARAAEVRDLYARTGRTDEAALLGAMETARFGAGDTIVGHLTKLVADPRPGPAGWTAPLEPDFLALRGTPDFRGFVDRLAERAT
jgi:tetratricopeptide (TPR) repeat protein